MRSAGNFSPEWGYLAPAPNFMRTARVVLVATAVGATAGAAVVLSLVERPGGSEATEVAAHAIVTSVQAATIPTTPAPSVPVAAVTPPAATPIIAVPDAVKPPVASASPTGIAPQADVTAPAVATAPLTAEPSAPAAPQTAAIAVPAENTGTTDAVPVRRTAPGIAALSDTSPTSDATTSDVPETPAIPVEGPQPQKKIKRTGPGAAKTKPNPTLGSVLSSLFNPHH
ncbi:MAG TPA: hypothetical protein VGH13_12690 [Xanthobacteraceae bacterium]|jgi:hypothetical protein